MIWTILVLIIAIALFLFGGMLLGNAGKKDDQSLVKKCINLVAIVLIAGCVTRLFTPYYLTSVNPMILEQMANAYQEQRETLQAKQQEEKNKAIREVVRSASDEMMANAPILGKADAKNTIFIWTDFSCPYCRRVHGELEKVLKARNDVRIVIKNFSIHGDLSDAPARAVIAAKMQDNAKAAVLVNSLMTKNYFSPEDMKNRAKLGETVKANVLKVAKSAGLDVKKLEKDMQSDVVSGELANVRELAQEFGVGGTPFLIINEQVFPGAVPYDQIVSALDNE